MSNVIRTAGVAGTFNYTLNQAPASAPVLTIYSDVARTVVVVVAASLAATANPAVFTASYPATLAAASYYLSFATVMTTGQPAFVDNDDTLELRAVSGDIEEPGSSSPDYATVEELKQAAGINDTVDDDTITLALSAASRMIDDHCHRRFWLDPTATVRYFTPGCDGCWVDDIGSLLGLVVASDPAGNDTFTDAWTIATHYRLLPRNAAADGRPWTRIETVSAGGKSWPSSGAVVRVTAKFGWPAVPSTVKEATLIQASRLWKRKDSPYGVAGVAELGSEMRLLAKLDPDVQVLVHPYWLPVLA